jgi:hypothetical protein
MGNNVLGKWYWSNPEFEASYKKMVSHVM